RSCWEFGWRSGIGGAGPSRRRVAAACPRARRAGRRRAGRRAAEYGVDRPGGPAPAVVRGPYNGALPEMPTAPNTVAAPPEGRRAPALLVALAAALLAQYFFTGELLTHRQDSQTWSWRPEFTAGTLLLIVALAAAWLAASGRPNDH